MAAAQKAASAAAIPTPEDRHAARLAWIGMAFPPLDRDKILRWAATIEALQASTLSPPPFCWPSYDNTHRTPSTARASSACSWTGEDFATRSWVTLVTGWT